MKNFFKTAVFAAFAFVVFGGLTANDARAQVINTVLNKMDAHYKALDALKSDVTMEKYNPQIRRSEVSKGDVTFLPKKGKNEMYLRLNWTSPSEEYLVVQKGKYVLYKKNINQAYTGAVSKAQDKAKVNGPLAFLSMSKQELKANYSAKYIGNEKVGGTVDAAHLELTPKAASQYKKVDIWVDENGMPVQVTVLEKSDDRTTVLLTAIQKNVNINYDVFSLSLPRGVNIIKDGK